MGILHNISLKPYNTFGIDVNAPEFLEIRDLNELLLLFQTGLFENTLVIGGGSNILFTGDFEGLVVKISIKGIEVVGEDDENVILKAGAGENWDQFVEFCVERGYGGLENLSGIPGCVGAAPIQNIGAYGVEMNECFEFLEAYNLETADVITYDKQDCLFGYRDSVFKNELKGKVIILSVSFRLKKNAGINLSYKALNERLGELPPESVTLSKVREIVLEIRDSKLPDPRELGNAGSFFKNPTVEEMKLNELRVIFPGIVNFPLGDGQFKIAAGWLIDQCGWKGYREGDAGIHEKQALVIVNHGKANGKQIQELAMKVKDSVYTKFGILLEPEVQII